MLECHLLKKIIIDNKIVPGFMDTLYIYMRFARSRDDLKIWRISFY